MIFPVACSQLNSPVGRTCPADCLELDHIFIFVSKDAPERELLIQLGLRPPDRVARHTGQGTASIGFVFENAYLELLWVEDEEEFRVACSANGGDFCAKARWRDTGASPFGIGLRNRCGQHHPPPLAHHEHRAEWMKPGSCIYMIDNDAGPREPEFFVVPPYMALPAWMKEVDTTHPLGVRRLTRVEVTVGSKGASSHCVSDFGVGSGFNIISAAPPSSLSRTARFIRRTADVRFHHGSAPVLKLNFDDARQRTHADLRPELPLVIEY